MNLQTPLCPECGRPALGTVEALAGVAEFENFEDPFVREYSGYTRVWWDEQKTKRNQKGEIELVCEEAHSWFSEVKE